MNNVRSIQDAKSATSQASEWIVLLKSGQATADDRARCGAWLKEQPSHQAAFDSLNDTWERLHAMGDHVQSIAEALPDPDAVIKYMAGRRRGSERRGRAGWAAVAATLLVVVLGGMLMYSFNSSTLYSTDIGQQMTITLPDHSTVVLNTDTELRVAYSKDVRSIDLHRGEAWFDVVDDSDRPFVVRAGQGEIRAVGTGFVVRMKQNDVVAVTVTEGIVEVTQHNWSKPEGFNRSMEADEHPAPTVSKGQRVEFGAHIRKRAVVPQEELDRELAWRQGLLIFDDQSLGEVIREVSRYTSTRLIISDDELRHLRVGGAFQAGDVEALLEFLEKSFDIVVERDGPRTIHLSTARAATAG